MPDCFSLHSSSLKAPAAGVPPAARTRWLYGHPGWRSSADADACGLGHEGRLAGACTRSTARIRFAAALNLLSRYYPGKTTILPLRLHNEAAEANERPCPLRLNLASLIQACFRPSTVCTLSCSQKKSRTSGLPPETLVSSSIATASALLGGGVRHVP